MLKIEENTKAMFRLGDSYFKTKKYEDALKYLEKAIKKNPKDEIILTLLRKTK